MFDLGDELQRAATATTSTKAVPGAFFDIDDELLGMTAVMNGTATEQLRPDALELGVEAIVSEDAGEWDRAANVREVDKFGTGTRGHRATPRERLRSSYAGKRNCPIAREWQASSCAVPE